MASLEAARSPGFSKGWRGGAALLLTLSAAATSAGADSAEQRVERYRQYLQFQRLAPPGDLHLEWLSDGSSFRYTPPGEKPGVTITVNPARNAVHRGPPNPADAVPPKRFARHFPLSVTVPVPEVPSPDGRHFALLQDGDVYVRSKPEDTPSRLTHTAAPGVEWDLDATRLFAMSEPVMAQPWSPRGDELFATRIDRRKLKSILEVDFLTPSVTAKAVPLERSGEPLPAIEIYVLDVVNARVIPIDAGDLAESFVTLLSWRPDGKEVLFARSSRDFKQVDVMAADPATGKARLILSERGERFVRIEHDVLYSGRIGFQLLPDGSGFLWLSQRDGWNHIYRYDFQGRLVRQLTRGEFPVLDVQAVDTPTGFVYFTAHAERRIYDTHLYRVPLRGGPIERLSSGEGQHHAQISPSHRYFVDTYSTVSQPAISELHRIDGKLIRVLERGDLSKLKAAGWMAPEEFVVKADDGTTDLWGILYKPADFDPRTRYPVVEHIYGGPQVVYGRRGFDALPIPLGNHPMALAQLGYVVVMLDGRGTPERSRVFHEAVYPDWNLIARDHAAAMRQLLASRAYMDARRVGIYGHSWGGSATLRALAEAPHVYKAGVASGPDFQCGVFLCEPYLGLLPQDRAAYDRHSQFSSASKIHGSLMLVAGTAEAPMMADIMTMSRALIDAGVQHQLIVLPGESHGYRGKALDYVLEATSAFFERNLKEARAPLGAPLVDVVRSEP